MIKRLKKRTEKIRYKCVSKIIKLFTPSLYKKCESIIVDKWGIVPRPSVRVMKERFNQKQVIGAEIGVSKGVNAESILKELNISKLYLVDVWANYKNIDYVWSDSDKDYKMVCDKFKKDKRVQIIRELSENAINKIEDNSLDFVYIDANHSYVYAYQDIVLWSKKVKIGGIVAGHDIYICEGVSKAVKKIWYENDINISVRIPDWYFIKENNNIRSKLRC